MRAISEITLISKINEWGRFVFITDIFLLLIFIPWKFQNDSVLKVSTCKRNNGNLENNEKYAKMK